MKNNIRNYIAFILLLLSLKVSAQGKYELIKINPEAILLAQGRQPMGDSVKRINLILQLQEKGIYYSSTDEFFKKDDIEKKKVVSVRSPKNSVRNSSKVVSAGTKKSAIQVNKVEDFVKAQVPANSADKLNSALKIPLNSNALKAGKNIASFGSSSAESREMAFRDIKKDNPELQQKVIENQQRGKNLIWAGLILVVLGGIMGFVFGRSAFLISLAGLVFAGIGYFFRV